MNKNIDKRVCCHRVVCSNGKIGGFNKGVREKIKLLKKEGVIVKDGRIDLRKYGYFLNDWLYIFYLINIFIIDMFIFYMVYKLFIERDKSFLLNEIKVEDGKFFINGSEVLLYGYPSSIPSEKSFELHIDKVELNDSNKGPSTLEIMVNVDANTLMIDSNLVRLGRELASISLPVDRHVLDLDVDNVDEGTYPGIIVNYKLPKIDKAQMVRNNILYSDLRRIKGLSRKGLKVNQGRNISTRRPTRLEILFPKGSWISCANYSLEEMGFEGEFLEVYANIDTGRLRVGNTVVKLPRYDKTITRFDSMQLKEGINPELKIVQGSGSLEDGLQQNYRELKNIEEIEEIYIDGRYIGLVFPKFTRIVAANHDIK